MKCFPCPVCKGVGEWIDVVIPETGQGPVEQCGYCEGEGMIEIGSSLHQRIRRFKLLDTIARLSIRDWSYKEEVKLKDLVDEIMKIIWTQK